MPQGLLWLKQCHNQHVATLLCLDGGCEVCGGFDCACSVVLTIDSPKM